MNKPKIFCLITCSRSGSNLFHSLLDRHPQVICFPRHLQFDMFWKNVWERKDNSEYLVDSFIKMHPRFFSGRAWVKYDRADQLGPDRNETFSVDTHLFREKTLSELNNKEITRRSLFISLHRAYHAACGREIPEDPIILYHIHYIDYIEEVRAWLSDFPDNTYALVMTRHPVDELNACINVMKWRDTLFCGELFNRHKQILRGILHFFNAFPNLDIRYLTFEQLLMNHEDVMKSFVNWVGIKWHDNLMASTMHGKLWWGNGKIPRNGISPGWEIYEPKELLEKKDWAVFRNLLPNRMRRLGYINQPEIHLKPKKRTALFLLFLPMATEWATLRSMFSLTYWRKVIKKIKEDVKDPRMVIRNNAYREMAGCVWRLNPVMWFYYLLRRVVYYYRFAFRNNGENEKVPMLLEGVGEK